MAKFKNIWAKAQKSWAIKCLTGGQEYNLPKKVGRLAGFKLPTWAVKMAQPCGFCGVFAHLPIYFYFFNM